MLDPVTAIYALLGGIGLVGADTYMNSSTIHLETLVAPPYIEEGFDPHLVEALFLAELANVIDAKSMIPTPHLVSSRDKAVSSEIAEAVGLSHALDAAKSTLGAKHPSLIMSILSEEKDGKKVRRIVIAGENSEEQATSISVPLNDRSLDEALKEAAFETMKKIDPYVTALHAFEVAEAENRSPAEAEKLLNEAIGEESKDLFNPERARLENLMGLAKLLSNDHSEARVWFEKSKNSDSSFAVADLNIGFIAAANGNCEETLRVVTPLLESSYWVVPPDEAITYPARNLLGICSARLKEFEQANRYFADAVDSHPDGTAVYYYWAESLAQEGRKEESEELLALARRNISRMYTIPEIAILDFWLVDDGRTKFQKRDRVVPALSARNSPSG